ncbi:hypothetical protein SteCoe_26741 [Stentor coeruleus]|uniref:Protein kinase domain-containing protein n=1 Tax=Stentor coeruleus TaxID=5963 RepID=A0A1R2BC55_9CILI|nr:hypothetical protein SteCoe_26741 [Stentor coeruleus]
MGCATVKSPKKCSQTNERRISPALEISEFKLLNHYVSLSLLGSGAFSEVILAKHIPTQSFRALKIVSKSKLTSQHFFSWGTVREPYILQEINYPGVIKFYECFDDLLNFYIVTEYCEGGSLFKKIKNSGRLSEENNVLIMYQLLKTVEYIHSHNIVHRDIKLENVLLACKQNIRIKLADFGNACHLTSDKKLTGCYGSACYLAPEVYTNSYDEKVDIWSCGILFYVLLSGKSPYSCKDPCEIKHLVNTSPFQLNDTNTVGFSSIAIDLLQLLLKIQPEQRISASDALKHPLFENISMNLDECSKDI